MIEFTKEQLINQAQKNISVLRGAVEKMPGASEAAIIHLRLAEITLASLTSEPVAWIIEGGKNNTPCHISSHKEYVEAYPDRDVTPLYTAPPAPVVPTFEEWCQRTEQKPVGWVRDAMKEAYDACRASMLQGAEGNPVDLSMLDSLAGEFLNESMNSNGKARDAYALCAHRVAETARDIRDKK